MGLAKRHTATSEWQIQDSPCWFFRQQELVGEAWKSSHGELCLNPVPPLTSCLTLGRWFIFCGLSFLIFTVEIASSMQMLVSYVPFPSTHSDVPSSSMPGLQRAQYPQYHKWLNLETFNSHTGLAQPASHTPRLLTLNRQPFWAWAM